MRIADQTPQVPNAYASDDMWGWRNWATVPTVYPAVSSNVSNNLKEAYRPDQIPSSGYSEEERVSGATVGQNEYVSNFPIQPPGSDEDTNPYIFWSNHLDTADYRCDDTQLNTFVRSQLARTDYLTRSNRVGPGPYRVERTDVADRALEVPSVYASDDMWGWQDWLEEFVTLPSFQSPLSDSLREAYREYQVPSASYHPYEDVGGATVGQRDYDDDEPLPTLVFDTNVFLDGVYI